VEPLLGGRPHSYKGSANAAHCDGGVVGRVDLNEDGLLDFALLCTGHGSLDGMDIYYGALGAAALPMAQLRGHGPYSRSYSSMDVGEIDGLPGLDVVGGWGISGFYAYLGSEAVLFAGAPTGPIPWANRTTRFFSSTFLGVPSVAIADDLNNDGDDALVIGLSEDDTSGANAGAVYVFEAPVVGTEDLVADADAVITGAAAGDGFGKVVQAYGDEDADGYGEFLVAAPYASTLGSSRGVVYLFEGPFTTPQTPANALATFEGLSDADTLRPLRSGYDFTGNQAPDVLLRAANLDVNGDALGAIYVMEGPFSGAQDLSQAVVTIEGEVGGDNLTRAAFVGDVNGDGHEDLLVGAPGRTIDGVAGHGAAYLFYGPLAGTYTLLDADAEIYAPTTYAHRNHGGAVGALGDINMDGYDDFTVSSKHPNGNTRTYIFLGSGGL